VRRLGVWCLTLPLALVGTEVAHALAYHLAYPEAAVRFRVLAQTGHGYFDLLPLALGLVGATLLLGFLADVATTARGRSTRSLPIWAFMLVPPLAYTIQELSERWLYGSNAPWLVVLQPTFRYGILLQLPFALLAFLVAWLLLRASVSLGRAIRLRAAVRSRRLPDRARPSFTGLRIPRPSLHALGHATRGPPVAVW